MSDITEELSPLVWHVYLQALPGEDSPQEMRLKALCRAYKLDERYVWRALAGSSIRVASFHLPYQEPWEYPDLVVFLSKPE